MRSDAILDSSAVLAVWFNEPGADRVMSVPFALVCAVNHAEIIGKLIDWGADDVMLDAAHRKLDYRIEPLAPYRAEIAGRLRRHPVARRLSLGDRACLSLALQTALPVLTADRHWLELELGLDVRLIR